ncbi:DUF4097 family beta strand repeat-containing protein [Arthrobacter sp. H14-L1]|uniref:DUF4097 family beta strand repeat-containing protein n=1 Tax=Arthrobacter sp. H14-L1 TaxID=2996697 RepID=UPI00226EDDA0|nr:DUF4097 family beta strand repeat-containing protein [Arthrobacter sp. H14-L1]MCY0904207.1 DUF4097 family beta strand repeat-containing protein [Arthrobacter sp. H14-L1]
MPEYQTNGPIDLALDVPVGRIEVSASERTDVDVRVDPSNPSKKADVRAAAETVVEYRDGRVTIAAPHRYGVLIGSGKESVDVTVDLPSGSRLTAETSVGWIRARGPLGATRIKSSTGDVSIERAAQLQVHASSGEVIVVHVDGDLELTSGNGPTRVDYVGGTSTLKASNGDIHVGVAGGALTAKLANGSISVREALDSVTARSSYGKIRIEEVSAGIIALEASFGEVLVGIRRGVAAWLDVQSKNGVVRNDMNADQGPAGSEGSVEVRVRTSYGDITVQPAIAQ